MAHPLYERIDWDSFDEGVKHHLTGYGRRSRPEDPFFWRTKGSLKNDSRQVIVRIDCGMDEHKLSIRIDQVEVLSIDNPHAKGITYLKDLKTYLEFSSHGDTTNESKQK